MGFVVHILVLLVLGTLQSISAGDDCKGHYRDEVQKRGRICWHGEYCCGDCDHRECCNSADISPVLTEDAQDQCYNSIKNHVQNRSARSISGVVVGILFVIVLMVCWRCPSCWIYKMCRMPQPAAATSTHRTELSVHYPTEPGYQPGDPQTAPYWHQPVASAQQTEPASVQQTEPASTLFDPPPSYEDVVGSPVVNHSGEAFRPGQQSYPIQPPVDAGYQDQPASTATAPAASANFLDQPAYNPNYVAPPPPKY